MSMPEQKPGRSKQDYETPDDFMAAFCDRFNDPLWDLAASLDNSKASNFFTEEQNSLKQDWARLAGVLWLNPPFAKIGPWAEKCADESRKGANVFMLVPASVGTEWFQYYVHRHAYVLALNPRLTFMGCKDPYPKDCMLCCYGNNFKGFDVWRWK